MTQETVNVLIIRHFNPEDKNCWGDTYYYTIEINGEEVERYEAEYDHEDHQVEGFVDGLRYAWPDKEINVKKVNRADAEY